jgi:hypothetical protein
MNQELFAFWRYDTFPYVLGGTVTKMLPSGRVETVEYGPGHSFMPIKILPRADGAALWQKLENLRSEYIAADKAFRAAWRGKAEELTPFIKKDT